MNLCIIKYGNVRVSEDSQLRPSRRRRATDYIIVPCIAQSACDHGCYNHKCNAAETLRSKYIIMWVQINVTLIPVYTLIHNHQDLFLGTTLTLICI